MLYCDFILFTNLLQYQFVLVNTTYVSRIKNVSHEKEIQEKVGIREWGSRIYSYQDEESYLQVSDRL